MPKNNSLLKQFITNLGFMLFPLLILSAVTYFATQSMLKTLEISKEIVVHQVDPLNRLQISLLRGEMPPHDYLITGDLAENKQFLRVSQEIDKAFDEVLNDTLKTEEVHKVTLDAQKEWERTRAQAKILMGIPSPVGNPIAERVLYDYDASLEKLVKHIGEIHAIGYREIDQKINSAYRLEWKSLFYSLVVFGIALGMAILSGVRLTRTVMDPLERLLKGVKHFEAGEYSYRLTVDSNEFGQLEEAFNAMAEKIKEDQAILENLASHDSLTGLYNRREFQNRMKEEMERSRRYSRSLCLLMIDVDHFKIINDTHGHQIGDEVLRHMAELMRRELRLEDFPARYGGEEFVVLLPETSTENGVIVAERIRRAIAAHSFKPGPLQEIHFTVSVGAASFSENMEEYELIASADRALYTAKNAGRNQVCSALKQ